jgi:hypothetical protein
VKLSDFPDANKKVENHLPSMINTKLWLNALMREPIKFALRIMRKGEKRLTTHANLK